LPKNEMAGTVDWYRQVCQNICKGITSRHLSESQQEKFWEMLQRKSLTNSEDVV
jgi:CTP:phosphocholine cytidylyltransferase-like protein